MTNSASSFQLQVCCKTLLTILLLILMAPAFAAEVQSTSKFGSVVVPQPQKPLKAEKCVEATDIMRRDHMTFLLHQRDATVIDGIRSPKYSLTGCINCHVPASSGENIIRSDNPEHFCAGCHQYASVKIDCFECHADRPVDSFSQLKKQPGSNNSFVVLNPKNRLTAGSISIHESLMQRVVLGDE